MNRAGCVDDAFQSVRPEPASARFACASQDVHLLAGPVADNLGLSDPLASDEDLRAALKDACLDDRVTARPCGLDTVPGENADR